MRVVFLLFLAGLSPQAAMAQTPFSIVSSAEGGWSSNISDAPGGPSDAYIRHDHDLSLRGSIGALDLRAGVQVQQMRYLTHAGENDFEVTTGIEAGLPLSGNVTLRMGYAATRDWTGTLLDLGGVPVDVSGMGVDHELLAEIIMTGDGRALVLGVDGLLQRPAESVLGKLPLPPTRLDPDISFVTVRLDGEWTSGDLVGLGRAHAFFTAIPLADQALFRREPTDGLRLASGMRIKTEALALTAYVGADTVWPQNAPGLFHAVPYLDFAAELALNPAVALSIRSSSQVGRSNPIDGVAAHELDSEAEIRIGLGERWSLSAQAGLGRESGLYAPHLQQWRRMAGAGLTADLTDSVRLTLSGRQEWVDGPAGAYDVARIGIGLAGRI